MTVQALVNLNGLEGGVVFTDETSNQVWTPLSATSLETTTLATSKNEVGDSCLAVFGNSTPAGLQATLANVISGDFTVECFAKVNSPTTPDKRVIFQVDYNSGASYFTAYFSQNLQYLYVYDTQDNTLVGAHLPATWSGHWIHIAVVRSGVSVKVYVNGLLKGTGDGVSLQDPIGELITIGQGTQGYLEGYVDDFRVSDVALYNNNFIPQGVVYFDLTPVIVPAYNDSHTLTGLILGVGEPTFIPFTSLPVSSNVRIFNGTNIEDDIVVTPDPTSVNMISGNVKKLSLPYGLKIIIISVELNSKVIGTTVSNPITGEYSVNVYPWVDEVIVLAEPDYGIDFVSSGAVTVGQLIHPTTPNKYVYEVIVGGTLGVTEPPWGSTQINSGGVTLTPVPLYRPLANGFIKPIITPI